MRINLNNTESIKVKDRDEAVKVIEEKMRPLMKEGDYLRWYKSESKFDKPNIAAIYNKRHEETNLFARIIGNYD